MSGSLEELKRAAGVSAAAVSYAFSPRPEKQSKISSATRERILRLAEQLGYHPSVLARGLAQSRSYALGLLLPAYCTVNIPLHYLRMFHGVSRALQESDYTLTVFFGCDAKFLSCVRQGRVDGVIAIIRQAHSEALEQLSRLGIPCVLLNGAPFLPDAAYGVAGTDFGGWAGTALDRLAGAGLTEFRLYCKHADSLVIDAAAARAFLEQCRRRGLHGTVIPDGAAPRNGRFPARCGALFRGQTPALDAWLASPKPPEHGAYFLAEHLVRNLHLPTRHCAYHASEEIGRAGTEMLLQAVVGGRLTRKQIPCRTVSPQPSTPPVHDF